MSTSKQHIAWICLAVYLAGCHSDGSPKRQPGDVGPREIYALGSIEPAGGILSISAIPGERLKALDPDVEVNRRVPADGILGLLTSFDLGKAQLEALINKKELAEHNRLHQIEVAKAQQAQAQASLAQAQAKLTELELQAEKLNTLEMAGELAAEDFAQMEQLHAEDPQLVTEHQLRKQRNEMNSKFADFTVTSKSYASSKRAAELAVAAAEANIRVARLSLEELENAYEVEAIDREIKVAKENLKRSVLVAPNVRQETLDNVAEIDMTRGHEDDSSLERGPYTVLKTFLRPGEFVSQTPILQLGDLSQMVCVAEVYEADVKDLHLGQEAVIRSPAFSGKYADRIDPETKERIGGIEGHIEQIGGVIGSPGLMNRNPLAPADRSVVEVRVRVDDPEAIQEIANRVGLQVTVEFEKPATADSKAKAKNKEQGP